MDAKKLREKRSKAIADARAIANKAKKEERDLTAEERQQVDGHLKESQDLKEDIDRAELLEAEERALETPANAPPERPDPAGGTGGGGGERGGAPPAAPAPGDAQERELWERFERRLRDRGLQIPGSVVDERRYAAYDEAARGMLQPYAGAEYRAAFTRMLVGGREAAAALGQAERRALEATDQTLGGALVAPVSFQRDLIKFIDDAVYLRQWGEVRTVTGAKSLGFPSLDADPADADWTSELATGSEDSSMRFGGREFTPNPLAKRIKISQKLLMMDAAAEMLVRDRMAYKFGVSMEKAGLVGSGASQPLGIFTPSPQGIPTSRDVSTGNGATAPTFEGLRRAKYALKGQYWPRARWLFHRDVLLEVALITDQEDRPIWHESQRAGEPDRLMGIPVFMSEFAPNTLASGEYVGVLGDFSFYWWADALGMTVQRLVELYAETNQVGFIGRLESDGMPVLAEAFVRVQLT